MTALFFLSEVARTKDSYPSLPNGYECEIWRPKLDSIKPAGLPLIPFGIWWVFHVFHIFMNRRYAVLLIRKDGYIVHRSCIFPGYQRFPFMGKSELQVGDIWTQIEERGKGFAVFALKQVLGVYAKNTRVWYLTESDNEASIRVAQKCGFKLHAQGERCKKWGLYVFGQYRMAINTISSDMMK